MLLVVIDVRLSLEAAGDDGAEYDVGEREVEEEEEVMVKEKEAEKKKVHKYGCCCVIGVK
jgi:hypothetical protein